jgi:hypothetical protein
VDTRDRHVNTVAVSLTLYKQHLPYSGTDICTSIILHSDSGLCDYCYVEDSIHLGWDAVLVDKQTLACQGSVDSHNTLPCYVGILLLMDIASYRTKAKW